MGWVLRRLMLEEWAIDALIHRLATQQDSAVASYYAVSPSTIGSWRRRLGIPAPPMRHFGPLSQVVTALRRGMRPGHWYGFAVLHALTGHTRQQVYTMLHRMTREGQLLRRGRPGAYLWQRPPAEHVRQGHFVEVSGGATL